MKKTLLLVATALVLIAGNARAAFTPLTNGEYQMVITGGCFALGACTTPGFGEFVDNGETVSNSQGTFGTGIAGDGVMGIIDFTFANGNIIVNSFSQDSYLATAGGTVALDVTNVSAMGGSIDNAGNMEFDPTGRIAIAQSFADVLGAQPWNIDDASNVGAVTGLYEPWTTGTSINKVPGLTDVINETLTGVALQDAGPGSWTGRLVSLGNVGVAWGFFFGTPYMEVYNVTISGPPGPGIHVSIDVSGGASQQCTETGGSTVFISVDVTLTGGAELASVDWTIDGTSSGSGSSITPFLALGQHTVEAVGVTTTGESDTDSMVVNVVDTTPPVVDAQFLDSRTGEPLSTVSGNLAHFVTTSFGVTDVCDPEPQAQGVVTPTFGVNDGDTIRIQGNSQAVELPTSALHLSVTATDSSGNSGNGQAILSISD